MDCCRYWVLVGAALGLLAGADAHAQSVRSTSTPTSGLGMASNSNPDNAMVSAMLGSAALANAQASGGLTSRNGTFDPVAASFLYGMPFPMNQTQAGLYLLSSQQRMLGIGSGQISGVRPGPQVAGSTGARSRTMDTRANPAAKPISPAKQPGGLAARYFNRRETPTARPQGFYNRSSRYFPHPAQ